VIPSTDPDQLARLTEFVQSYDLALSRLSSADGRTAVGPVGYPPAAVCAPGQRGEVWSRDARPAQHVVVVGGGIAGAAAARRLRTLRRTWR
jgi:NADPH-dependent 2,4-dienoyl-CoA reductase/sulfur reductase-like enzyme